MGSKPVPGNVALAGVANGHAFGDGAPDELPAKRRHEQKGQGVAPGPDGIARHE